MNFSCKSLRVYEERTCMGVILLANPQCKAVVASEGARSFQLLKDLEK
jgi:hypothetical protein